MDSQLLSPTPAPGWYQVSKRVLDLVVGSTLLISLSPVYAVTSLIIKASDSGPVFYRATRVGRHGRDFTMLKFRTMVPGAELIGGSSTSSLDTRITGIGRVLRKWKVDEMPQLINVLRGEMSIVGPRPQVRWDVERYTAEETCLLNVKPGVTDWASIRFRNEGDILSRAEDADEAYDRLIRPEKIRMGLDYVATASFRQDLAILVATVRAIIQNGAPPVTSDVDLGPAYSDITEGWDTRANTAQWKAASQRYSLAASLGLNGVVAEIGCGTGYGLSLVAKFAKVAVGVDVDQRNLVQASQRTVDCRLLRGDACKLPLRSGSVDCVIGLEMLYYLANPNRFIEEAHRVLRRRGKLLITLPNHLRPGFHASDLSVHYLDAEEIASLLQRAGFQVQLYGSSALTETRKTTELVRRLLTRFDMIPHSIEGRARLKRYFFVRMRRLETIKVDPRAAYDGLEPVSGVTSARPYAVLNVIGTRD